MRRTFYGISAVVSLIAAFLLLVNAGLPDLNGDPIPGVIPIAPQMGSIAPDFTATSVDGQIIKLAETHNATVILNFWATWCGPCKVEMPILQRLHENHPDVRILAINMGETPSTIREWQRTADLTYDLLVDKQQAIAALYRLRGQPSTYIIAPGGMITDIFFGPVSETALVAAILRSSG